MAFHDMWGKEEDSGGTARRPYLKWTVFLLGGVIVGAGIYAMLLPGGILHSAIPSPVEATPQSTAVPTATLQPTPCRTPLASPPQTVTDFAAALNNENYDAAWNFLAPTLQQSLYAGQRQAFINDWAAHGQIEIGQMTYSQTGGREANLLARFNMESPAGAAFDYTLSLRYDPGSCRWLIIEIALPFKPTPTPSSSATPNSDTE